MDQEKFKTAVREMRHWQKKYFKFRNPVALQESRSYEKQVDQMLAEDEQPKLFDQ